MEITVTRTALLAALTPAARILEKRNPVPILNNVLLRARAGRVEVEATNMDLTIVDVIAADISVEGETTIPGQLLLDLSKKFGADDPIRIAPHGTQADTVVVTSGRSRTSLRTLPASDYPTVLHKALTHRFDVEARVFRGLLARCAFAMSDEETRYYLRGVNLHQDMKHLVGAATDGHRLCRTRIPLPEGADKIPSIIIPSSTVIELLKALDVEGGATIEMSDTYIAIQIGDRRITSKLVDGSFPDYQRVIPADNEKVLRVCPRAFATAIGRVSTISSERGRGVDLRLQNGSITMSMHAPDQGEAVDEIEAAFDGGDFTVGFNARYMTEILSEIGGPEVEFRLADPGSPALIIDVADTDSVRVLMPMRTRS